MIKGYFQVLGKDDDLMFIRDITGGFNGKVYIISNCYQPAFKVGEVYKLYLGKLASNDVTMFDDEHVILRICCEGWAV